MNRLFVPEDIQGKITSGNAVHYFSMLSTWLKLQKAVTSVADSVGQLLVELRQHKKEACPGKLARDFWKKTGKFDPRVMKKVIQSTSAPIVSYPTSSYIFSEIIGLLWQFEKQTGNEKTGSSRKSVDHGDDGGIDSTVHTQWPSGQQKKKRSFQLSSTVLILFFLVQSTLFSGYIPPKVKYFAGKEVGQEHNLVVFRKRFTQNKPVWIPFYTFYKSFSVLQRANRPLSAA